MKDIRLVNLLEFQQELNKKFSECQLNHISSEIEISNVLIFTCNRINFCIPINNLNEIQSNEKIRYPIHVLDWIAGITGSSGLIYTVINFEVFLKKIIPFNDSQDNNRKEKEISLILFDPIKGINVGITGSNLRLLNLNLLKKINDYSSHKESVKLFIGTENEEKLIGKISQQTLFILEEILDEVIKNTGQDIENDSKIKNKSIWQNSFFDTSLNSIVFGLNLNGIINKTVSFKTI